MARLSGVAAKPPAHHVPDQPAEPRHGRCAPIVPPPPHNLSLGKDSVDGPILAVVPCPMLNTSGLFVPRLESPHMPGPSGSDFDI